MLTHAAGSCLLLVFDDEQRCHVGAAASLARAHQAASELKEGLRPQMPEIADIVVHTEP